MPERTQDLVARLLTAGGAAIGYGFLRRDVNRGIVGAAGEEAEKLNKIDEETSLNPIIRFARTKLAHALVLGAVGVPIAMGVINSLDGDDDQLPGTVSVPNIDSDLIDWGEWGLVEDETPEDPFAQISQLSSSAVDLPSSPVFDTPIVIELGEGISQAAVRTIGVDLTPEQAFEVAVALADDNGKTDNINLVHEGEVFAPGERTNEVLRNIGILQAEPEVETASPLGSPAAVYESEQPDPGQPASEYLVQDESGGNDGGDSVKKSESLSEKIADGFGWFGGKLVDGADKFQGTLTAGVGRFLHWVGYAPTTYAVGGEPTPPPDEPTPTPDPTPTAQPTPTPPLEPTPSPEPSPEPTPSPEPPPEATPTPQPTPTLGPSPTPTPEPTPEPTPSPEPSPEPTPSPEPSPEPTPSPEPPPEATPTPQPTPTPSPTPTPLPEQPPGAIPPTPTPTPLPEQPPGATPTPKPSPTPTLTPTLAPTSTPRPTPTPSPTPTPTPRPAEVIPTPTPVVPVVPPAAGFWGFQVVDQAAIDRTAGRIVPWMEITGAGILAALGTRTLWGKHWELAEDEEEERQRIKRRIRRRKQINRGR